MKTGYDQFFKKAQKVAEKGRAKPIEKRKIQFTDSNAMAEELRVRMRPMLKEQQKKRKPKKSIPWKIVGFSLIGLLIAGLCLWKSDEIDRLARKVEVEGVSQPELLSMLRQKILFRLPARGVHVIAQECLLFRLISIQPYRFAHQTP
jgi:hypothetical protein